MGENHNKKGDDGGLKGYIIKLILMGIVLAVVVVVVLEMTIGYFETTDPVLNAAPVHKNLHQAPAEPVTTQVSHTMAGNPEPATDPIVQTSEGSAVLMSQNSGSTAKEKAFHGNDTGQSHAADTKTDAHVTPATPQSASVHQTTDATQPAGQKTEAAHVPASASGHTQETHNAGEDDTAAQAIGDHDTQAAETGSFPVAGMAFVDTVIQPLDYELNQRFYGWRPNDILDFTDNVNNIQLGVLEVTRRTAVILSERISRTGTTASFDVNLQNAMNWFMIKPDRYWFPSAESKYKAGLKELRTYFHRLEKGEAQFYTRTDNLIPLLMVYQDLLGSCDENLVKSHEDDGSPVSHFKSDDYFFYAQGVAGALATMLEGIATDFHVMVNRRGGMEELHHAIQSCHHAMEIDPWIILNSDLSSLFANHRLNMAAPISHARFFLGVLIKALST